MKMDPEEELALLRTAWYVVRVTFLFGVAAVAGLLLYAAVRAMMR
jgi:hypothetical protein